MFAMLRFKDMPIWVPSNMSVCLSTCNKCITTECIFMEYYWVVVPGSCLAVCQQE